MTKFLYDSINSKIHYLSNYYRIYDEKVFNTQIYKIAQNK